MRALRIGLCGIAAVGLCSVVLFGQREGGGQAAGRGAAEARGPALPSMVAPTDKSVLFTQADLQAKFKEMDAKEASGWRLIEGKTHNVNIRMETVDNPLVHPNTVDIWVIERGSGSMVTGGKIVDGKIVGGVENKVAVGDIVFIPANLPHSLNTTERNPQKVTWMNIRYDMVPPGTLPGDQRARGAAGRGAAPAAGAGRGDAAGRGGAARQGGAARGPAQPSIPAPTDKAIFFSKADLEAKFKELDQKKLASWRLIEGGTHNHNIRIETVDNALVHPLTVDVWVIERGHGSMVTGGKIVDGKIVGGVESKVGVGDIVFIPAGLPHSLNTTEANPVEVTWMNLRYDMQP